MNPHSLCPGCMAEKVSEGKCPICGYNPDELQNPQHLKINTLLESRYLIGKAIDSNGESTTYLGYDTVTQTIVNIREYFPLGLCDRDVDGTVVMSAGSEFNYNEGLMQFLKLSRELFKLNELPALFDVLDVREANNTAYRITRAVPGLTLREFLLRNGGVLKWDQARSLFAPLISSISALHKAGIIHRGISPDTLIVGKDGKLRLNGFCIEAARTAKSEFTSQLFPGFAAVEQYGVVGSQGPWTDVYAFAATIYRTLVGNPPPEATERLQNDNMTIPAKIARETPKAVLETLANALQVLPNDRTQYIDNMRRGLSVSSAQVSAAGGAATSHTTVVSVPGNEPVKPTPPVSTSTVTAANADTLNQSDKKGKSTKVYGIIAFVSTALLLAVIIIFLLWSLGFIGGGSGKTESNNNNSKTLPSNSAVSLATPSTPSENGEYGYLDDFTGKYYSDIYGKSDYANKIKFKIVRKEYSSEYEAGQIIFQSPAPDSQYEIGKTTVELVISEGDYYISMPKLSDMTPSEARVLLLKLGFRDVNIQDVDVFVADAEFGAIVGSTPEAGTKINVEEVVEIKINRYESTDDTDSPESTEPLA